MNRVYRIHCHKGRFGEMWFATPQPGYNSLLFPVLAGATTLGDCVDRAYKQIEKAKSATANRKRK